MGSYNIISFLLLVGLIGILSLISILFGGALVDTANILIGAGFLSVDTVNTLSAILNILHWAPVICIISLAVWAISSAVNNTRSEDE